MSDPQSQASAAQQDPSSEGSRPVGEEAVLTGENNPVIESSPQIKGRRSSSVHDAAKALLGRIANMPSSSRSQSADLEPSRRALRVVNNAETQRDSEVGEPLQRASEKKSGESALVPPVPPRSNRIQLDLGAPRGNRVQFAAKPSRGEDAKAPTKAKLKDRKRSGPGDFTDEDADDEEGLDDAESDSSDGVVGKSTEKARRRYPDEKYESYKKLKSRVLKLCREELWKGRQAADFALSKLKGGSYNRIVAITVSEYKPSPPAKASTKDRIKQKIMGADGKAPTETPDMTSKFNTVYASGDFILRVPRVFRTRQEFDFDQDRAIHEFFLDRGISCPKFIKHDMSASNALGAPYELQERVEGQALWYAYQKMNQKQRVQIAAQVGKICSQLVAKTAPEYGELRSISDPFLNESGEIERTMVINEPRWISPRHRSSRMTTAELLKTAFEHHEQRGRYSDVPWASFRDMVDQLQEENAFGAEGWYLTHGDFYPRNMMAKIDADDNAQVTSVLDWDMAHFVPQVLACKPPAWLWLWDFYSNQPGDEDNLDVFALGKLPEKDREIKEAFDKAAGPEYCAVAYGPHNYTARKLCRWAQLGHDNKIGEHWVSWVAEYFVDAWFHFESDARKGSFPRKGIRIPELLVLL